MLKLVSKKRLHSLEDSGSSIQVDVLNTQLSKIGSKHDKITLNIIFVLILRKWSPQAMMDSRNMRKRSNLKIFKVMKSTSKTRINHYLLSSISNDKCRPNFCLFDNFSHS